MKLSFSLPQSRLERKPLSNMTVVQNLSGFNGRVQKEFNCHPVRMYMGPYDQNRNLKLNVQLPGSSLDFEKYTEFSHSGDQCFEFVLKKYGALDILNKIDSYCILNKIDKEIFDDPISEVSDDDSNDRKNYTCHLGDCKIPCPCPQCYSDLPQCNRHRMKHEALFDEKHDAISIRTSEEFCLDQNFFKNSYVIRYSGIPIDCMQCKEDLLSHHSYHFEYHEKCRFCKPSWFKYKAKNAQELRSLSQEEKNYFKRVCPFCDKQFITASHVKKHTSYEHNNGKIDCDFCEKRFSSQQAKKYHERICHSQTRSKVTCDQCQSTFSSHHNLLAHQNNVHIGKRCVSCPKCEKTFKQAKNMRAHMSHVHDIDQQTEKY